MTSFNLNTSLISDYGRQKQSYLKGYSSLKDRYQGTLVKSFFEDAKQRQNLSVANEPDANLNQT
jgi:hypothetical protein